MESASAPLHWEVEIHSQDKADEEKGKHKPHNLITIHQPQSSQIDVLQKVGYGHQVDRAVAFFSPDTLIPKSLREKEVGHKVWWIGLDHGKDDHR